MQELIRRAKELLADGTVARVLGWKAGDMPWNPEPAFFENEEELKDFVYDGFCGANLSKMMIEASKLDGKTLVCLKPCDTYSFNQLLSEHRVDREKAYIIGVGCKGKLDIEKIRSMGIRGIRNVEGASLEDAADTLKFETASGERPAHTRMPCLAAAMSARARSIRSMMSGSASRRIRRIRSVSQR